MNIRKKVTIAGSLFLLLAGATFLSTVLSSRNQTGNSGRFFASYDSSKVTKVTLGDSLNGVILKRTSAGWVVTDRSKAVDYRADQVKVTALLDKIGLMEKEQLVSDNRANYVSLGVTKESGMTVEVYTASTTADIQFYLGKQSENWRNCNVRVEKEKAVYLTSGSLRYAFFTEIGEWRDKRIVSHSSDSITKVILADGSSIEKVQGVGESYWVARLGMEETRANADNVASYLEGLTRFVCDDWADETIPDMAWINPTANYAITIVLTNGTSETITLGRQDPSGRNRFYFKNSAKKDLYFVIGSGAQIPFMDYQYMVAPPQTNATPAAGLVKQNSNSGASK